MPVIAGTVAGVGIALAAGRVIGEEFLGVAAADASALGIAIAAMGLIAGVAVSIMVTTRLSYRIVLPTTSGRPPNRRCQ